MLPASARRGPTLPLVVSAADLHWTCGVPAPQDLAGLGVAGTETGAGAREGNYIALRPALHRHPPSRARPTIGEAGV